MSGTLKQRIKQRLDRLRTAPAATAIATPALLGTPRRRTLVLHIGMGKTGTTAIQTSMWRNRSLLRRHGILYPRIGSVAKAHHLVSPRCPPFLAHTGWRFLKVEEWAPRLARSTGADLIVMSSELIASAEPDQVAAFCKQVGETFDLRVCLYLRRQDNAIMAAYNQMIKAGTQVAPVDKAVERGIDAHDYLKVIWPWEKAIGSANLIVAPYERAQFRNGDILDDFLFRVAGIDRPDGFVADASNPNPRLSRGAMEYKRRINILRHEPGWTLRFNDVLAGYCDSLGGDSRAVFHEHDLLSRDQRERIMRVAGPANAYIARKFLGRDDGRLFLDEDIPADMRRPGRSDPRSEFAAITHWIAVEQPQLVADLQDLIASGRGSGSSASLKAADELAASFEGHANKQVRASRKA